MRAHNYKVGVNIAGEMQSLVVDATEAYNLLKLNVVYGVLSNERG